MYDFKGKVALVTGAGSETGIGRACAVRLASEGADVAVADVVVPKKAGSGKSSWGGLDAVAAEIAAKGRKALPIVADVSNSADVQRMVKQTLDKFGKIDILVSNAGIAGVRKPVREIPEEGWNRTMAVNLTGTFLVCKAASQNMIDRGKGGKIIITASINGKRAWPERSDYCASKFAVIGFTNSLAGELAKFKINVNALCPGLVETDIHRGWIAAEAKSKGVSEESIYRKYYDNFVSQVPWGRNATGEDMAKVVAFLASDEAEYITGQAINVDGGFVMER